MISRLLGDERGVALIMATAFMLLSIPLTIAALQLASTLARTSQTQTGFLLSQYSTQGAQEYILHVLSASSTPSSGTSTLTINGRTVTTSVLKLLTPPTDLPITSFKTKLLTTKEASPTSISPSATTTYTITVENKHRKKVDFKKVVDELPRGFTYAPNSSVLVVAGGAPITPDEPTLKDGELKWTIAAGTKLQVGESATLTFTAVAPPETGRYCNEVYAEKGGKKTRSGKTAIVTVEPNTDTECTGTAVSLYKTVSPEFVFGDTATTYTYTIEITNEGTTELSIKEIKDFMPNELTYVSFSASSTPAALHPGEPKIKTKAGKPTELKWKAPKSDPWRVATGTTWWLEFKVTGTLPRGWYANEVKLRFDKTRVSIQPSAVSEDDPVAGTDTYTYDISVFNDGTEVLEVEEVKIITAGDEDFTYVTGSATSTVPHHLPLEPTKLDASKNKIEWKFNPDVPVAAGDTWTLQLKATTALPAGGDYPIAVIFVFDEHPDDVKPSDRVTGPTAVITSLDIFQITITDGDSTIVCNVWFVSEFDVDDYQVVEGCTLG